ncbi:hypothetical protein [Streptomyces mirabilis]|uniref:hypothetical protein n=1 Tax=Streptomyces mirabilis TaxID=68239 RepID=UPI003694E455
MATTRHTCGGPVFGRLTDGCPRCDELSAGAEPVQFSDRTDDRPKTTQHTHQVVFGRRVTGCPRCTELAAGAAPVRWTYPSRREQDEQRTAEISAHFAPGSPHSQGACGPVCTFGDW